MPVLSKGTTFSANTQVLAANLNDLVDGAAFASGAVDSVTTQLASGAIVVKDLGISPAKLSTGGPTWTAGGALTANAIQNTPVGTVTPSPGAFTTLDASGAATLAGAVSLTGDTIDVAEGGTGASTVGTARAAFSFDSTTVVSYAASVALDLADRKDLKTVTLAGNITFSTTGRASGLSYFLRIVGDGSSRTITVPASWVFCGRQPTSNTFTLGANKTAVLALACFGTAETDVVALYADQT